MADDLLDLQGPQLPSFLEMANASQPRMMPNSPSPFAGLMYGQDAARHDTMLQKAAYLAQLRQQQDAQKQAEFEAAAPGRMDEIALKNKMAGVDLGDAGTLASARTEANRAKVTEALSKGADAQQKLLKDYGVDGWSGAPNSVKRAVYKDAQDKHLAFANQSFEDFDGYMNHIAAARENEPNIMKSIYGANMRYKGQQAIAGARVDVANIQVEGRKWLSDHAPKNMSMSQWEASVRDNIKNGKGTTEDYDALNHLVMEREHNALIKASTAPGTMELPGLPPRTPPAMPPAPGFTAPQGTPSNGQAAAPAAARVTPLPREIASKLRAGVGTHLSDGSTWTLDKDGTPIMIAPPSAK